MKLKYLLTMAALAVVITGCHKPMENDSGAQPDWERLKLHYTKPATQWDREALPVGNGRLGAMCFGGVPDARIQLNEESIWAGPPYPETKPEFREAMEKARALWFAGDFEASSTVLRAAMAPRISPRSHQTMGDLEWKMEGVEKGAITDYSRELDLDRAIATTRYVHEGITYTREVWVTAVDDVIVIRQSASGPGKLNGVFRLSRPEDYQTRATAEDTLIMSGQAQHKGKHLGVKWTSMLKVKPEGGTVSQEEGQLRLSGADRFTVYLTCYTDYNRSQTAQPLTADRIQKCEQALQRAMARSYDQMRADHIAEHRDLFRRCSLSLGGHEASQTPTDQRLDQFQRAFHRSDDTDKKENFESASPPDKQATRNEEVEVKDQDLIALYFQYGRYLLIGSSRPGTLPANLQGIWNDRISAPWNADYHININMQMNYWPAEVTNLSELHEPFFSFIERLVPSGKKAAREAYGCEGFMAHHTSDVWHWTAPMGALQWGMWPHGGAWCTAHFMEHYRYTGNREFLEKRAWPIISEAARFYLGYLVEHPEKGKLVSGLDNSPENKYLGPDGKPYAVSMGGFHEPADHLGSVYPCSGNC
jgi:alpha-L-fucosidase 2